jgi:drug/metabolite transporter (DMT)-like permease
VTTLWVVVGGLFSGLLGNILFNTGLRRIPTTAASALTYLEPLTASLLGWVFFQEALGPWALVGAALVLGVGVWVAAEPRRSVDSPLPAISGTP